MALTSRGGACSLASQRATRAREEEDCQVRNSLSEEVEYEAVDEESAQGDARGESLGSQAQEQARLSATARAPLGLQDPAEEGCEAGEPGRPSAAPRLPGVGT